MFKPLFTAISDVHVKLSTQQVSIQVLRIAAEKSRELGIPCIINGDLNDTKALLRSECMKALIDFFKEYEDIHFYINVGNHDLNNKNSDDNSLEFLALMSHITVVGQPTEIILGTHTFMMIPYMKTNEDFYKAADLARSKGIKNLFTHQGYLSAFMGDYVIDDSSVNPADFADFDIIISGHYHLAQKVGTNIQFLGSPFTVNFGEAGHEKFYWVFGDNDNILVGKTIPTNVRKHVQIEIIDKLPRKSKSLILPPESLLKVVIKGTKEFCTKIKKEKIQELYGVQNVVIATDITRHTENRISQDKAHNPQLVIDEYLLNCETDFDRGELQKYIRSVASDIFANLQNFVTQDFRISRVVAENFLSYGSFEYDYRTDGLTLIEGFDIDNQVSTGAGKSTFMDAPFYGMYGKTSKNLKADEVVNRTFKNNMKVVVFLESESGEFQIVRYRKHKEFKNDLYIISPEGQELRGKDNLETQKLIDGIIGCSSEIFLQASYFTQFSLIDQFLSASDTEKKKLITDISDTKVYDELENIVKLDIKDQKEALASLQLEHERAKASGEEIVNSVNNLKQADSNFEVAKATELDALELDRSSWSCKRNDRLKANNKEKILWDEQQNKRVLESKERVSAYIQSRAARLEKIQRDIDDDVKKDEDYKKHIGQAIAQNTEKVIQLTETNEGLKGQAKFSCALEKERLDSKMELVKQLESKCMSEQSRRTVLQSDCLQLSNKVKLEEEKLLHTNSECSVCHQTVSAEHINNYIATLTNDINAKHNEVSVINKNIESITAGLTIKPEIEAQMVELIKLEAKQEGVKSEILNNESQITTLNSIILDNKQLIQKEFISPNELILEKAKGEVNPHQDEEFKIRAEINPYIEMSNRIEGENNPFEAKIIAAKSLVSTYPEMIRDAKQNLQESIAKITNISNGINETNHRLDIGLWWKDALHVYIKSFLMDSFIEQINYQANLYLERLFNGILKINISATTESGKNIKEKISVDIINENDVCSYQSLSGGERSRICLAVNLSLSDVIANTSGKSFKMLMLDEVFNGLDESGKEQTMNLLKSLEDRFETIFVIDHSTEFKSLFSNNIMIKKEKGLSHVVLNNNAV